MKKIVLLLFISVVYCQLSIAQLSLAKQWDKRFGGGLSEYLMYMNQTTDGGYILGGFSWSPAGGDKTQGLVAINRQDYWIVKIDSLGNKQWDKDFGGVNSDILYDMQQTSDGGYIMGGYSTSLASGDKTQSVKGIADYWVVKTDSLGNKQWDKDYGGYRNNYSRFQSLTQTTDGGYIFGGASNSPIANDKSEVSRGGYDYWVVKTDALGVVQWDKTFGGTSVDYLYSLRQTKDGGYILGGTSNSGIGGEKTQTGNGGPDYWILKIDSLGNKQWDKDFGGTANDSLHAIQQTPDGGYILSGISNSGIGGDKTQASYGLDDFWIIKIDSLGNKQWDKDLGGNLTEDDFGNIFQTADSGYLISGTSYSNISGSKTENNLSAEQTWIIKIDSLGNKQWDKTLLTNTPSNEDESGFGIQTKDGSYVFANETFAGTGGYKTQTTRGESDYWIIKFGDSTLSALPNAVFISSDTVFCDEAGSCIDFFDHSTNNPISWKWSFPGAIPDTSTQQNPTSICYSTPGTFAVTLIVNNSNGSDSLTITPMITFATGGPPPVLTFSGDTLYCSHASAYQWYFNGSLIPSATDSFYVALVDGVYAVQITDSNGCTRLSNGFTVSVNEVSSLPGIKIYPNPAGEELFVMSYGLWIGKTMIEIHNVLGEKVLQSEFIPTKSELKTEINVAGLANGIYMVEVVNKDKVFRAKFVKD